MVKAMVTVVVAQSALLRTNDGRTICYAESESKISITVNNVYFSIGDHIIG